MHGSPAPTPPPDARLVSLSLDGDKEAFGLLVARHRPMAIRVTSRLLGNEDLAADAVQEATVIALLSLHRLRTPDRFGSWLCGIALNVTRRWLRQARPIDPLADVDVVAPGRHPEEIAEASLIAAELRGAIDELPPGQRRATLLFYLQGLSYRETATELGISVGAVKSRLHKARAGLAQQLHDNYIRWEARPMTDADTPTTAPPSDWTDVTIADVRAGGGDTDRRHVVVLQDLDGRQLPIWIGPAEATFLAIGLEDGSMPRPLTYEFAAALVGATGGRVVEVRLTALTGDVFYAVVVVERAGDRREVDARPSDALNLAVIADVPIRAAASILQDPNAVERSEWKDYPDSAPQLAGEAMRKLRP